MEFKPTWLYVKKHTVTGMLYFGKTVRDPYKYNGSGLHWMRHRRKHGLHEVDTLWVRLFTDEEKLTRYALRFSRRNDIVTSPKWANMIPETGLGGGAKGANKGWKHSEEAKVKIRAAQKGIPKTAEHNLKNSQANLGKTFSKATIEKIRLAASNPSDEVRAKMSAAKKGRPPHNKGKPGPSPSRRTRRRLSAALKGKPGRFTGCSHSEETKARIQESMLGRVMTVKHRSRIAEALRTNGRKGTVTWKTVDGKRVYSTKPDNERRV